MQKMKEKDETKHTGQKAGQTQAHKRQLWQERLAKARQLYQEELDRMDEQDRYYNGTRQSRGDPNTGLAALRLSSNVRNIVYELIESQIDPTIPMPRVEAVHREDQPLARKIEALLRNRLTTGHFSEMNDLQERTVPIQGGSFWQVEWDNWAGTHCTLGDVTVSDRHPKQVIPQPGVTEIEQMDYLFLQVSQTKNTILHRYGVNLEEVGEEEPGLRGSDEVQGAEDLVTQNIAYYRNNKGGIGLFSWVDDVTLEDRENYQARQSEDPSPKRGQSEPEGENGPAAPQGEKKTGGVSGRVLYDQSRLLPEEQIPDYEPGLYPLVLRRNIHHYGSFLGGSDVAIIEDQQDSIKKMGAKIDEKILKGGSYVTLPRGVNVETTDREFKVLRIDTPAQKALIDVLNIQPDPTRERMALEDNYAWAKSTLGITDAFQGKYDSSAISGTAKQFSANQAAGRLQSKREMKNQAYARLFELMFKFLLAYSDQPVPYTTRDERGEVSFDHFDRWEFLRRDAAGQLYWDDEFVFSVDPSATLSSNRDLLWQQIAQNYQSAAFGPLNETGTQVLLWRLYELTGYPYAGEIRKALEAKQAQEQATAQPGQMGRNWQEEQMAQIGQGWQEEQMAQRGQGWKEEQMAQRGQAQQRKTPTDAEGPAPGEKAWEEEANPLAMLVARLKAMEKETGKGGKEDVVSQMQG